MSDALLVPNAALRFKPAVTAPTGARKSASDSTRARGAARDSTMTTLWSLDSTSTLKPVRVHAGLTDGTRTQVSGASIAEGMQIVVGANTGTTPAAAATTSKNPLQPQSTGRRGGPGGPF